MASSRDIELALRIRADVEQALREIRSFRGDITRVGRTGSRASRDMDRLARSGQRTASVFGQLRGVLATIGIGLLVREVVRAEDTYNSLQGRLRLVISDMGELNRVEQELFDSAQRTRSGYESTVGLFTRLARSTRELGVSNDDLLELTETINQLVIVSGAGPEAARNALFQLGQAFAGGVLRAEEFNSVVEQTPRLAQAIADGMGVGIGELRRLVNEGEVTAERIFQALRSQRETAEREFSRMPRTIGQALVQLQNDFQRALASGDLDPVVEAIDELRTIVSDPGFVENMGHLISGVARLLGLAAEGAGELAVLGRRIGAIAAAVTGNLSELDRITLEIEDVDRALKNSFFGRPTKFLFKTREELEQIRAELVAQREELLAQQGVVSGAAGGPPRTPAPAPVAVGGGEDDDAAEKAREALAKLNDELRKQVQTFGQGAAEVLEYRLTLGDLADDVARLGPEGQKLAESILTQARALEELEARKAADEAAEKARNDVLREGKELTEQLRTAQEVYNDELQRYAFLLQEGAISQETFNRAVAAARDRLEEAQEKAGETGEEMSEFAKQAARNIQSVFADFLFDPFDEGLKGMLRGFVDVVHRMISEALAAQLAKALLGGIGGAIGGPFGAALSALVAHEGGEVGDPSMPRRSVSPLLFLGAPRLHNGLAPDEFPAILQRGESVLTREQTDALEQQGGAGGRSLRVVLTDDRSNIGDYLATAEGEDVIVQAVRRNAFAIKQVIG